MVPLKSALQVSPILLLNSVWAKSSRPILSRWALELPFALALGWATCVVHEFAFALTRGAGKRKGTGFRELLSQLSVLR